MVNAIKKQMERANALIERLARSLGTDPETIMQAIEEELQNGDGRLVGAIAELQQAEHI